MNRNPPEQIPLRLGFDSKNSLEDLGIEAPTRATESFAGERNLFDFCAGRAIIGALVTVGRRKPHGICDFKAKSKERIFDKRIG